MHPATARIIPIPRKRSWVPLSPVRAQKLATKGRRDCVLAKNFRPVLHETQRRQYVGTLILRQQHQELERLRLQPRGQGGPNAIPGAIETAIFVGSFHLLLVRACASAEA